MPLVSVITPLYNAQSTIEHTLDSVAAQTFGEYEHIIIDNASTDEGARIVQERAARDPRIVFLSQSTPGAGPTRNAGIEAARGRYIAFLDADDTWDPEKLECQIRFMQENDLVMSWTSYRVDSGQESKENMPIRRADRKASAHDYMSKKTAIGCLTVIYDTEHYGKSYMSDIQKRQDFVLFVSLLRRAENTVAQVGGLDEVLATYKLHQSLSSNKASAARYQWQALTKECGLSKPKAAAMFAAYAWHGIMDRIKIKASK